MDNYIPLQRNELFGPAMSVARPRADERIASLAVEERQTARSLERHHQRLRNISQHNVRRNNVGNAWIHSQPQYEHLRDNRKRAQLQGERFGAINRENRLLLQKIGLMEQKAVDPTVGTWEFAPGVRLNRFQVPVIDHAISVQPHMPTRGSAKVPESLNRTARKRELERITRENLGIVYRIQTCTPYLRADELRHHAAEHERHMNRIRKPKLGLGFHSPPPSPQPSRPSTTPSRGATPGTQPRRVFTQAAVFEPFSRRGEPVPSTLLREAPAESLELLVGLAAGFLPGAMAMVADETVTIATTSLCRAGLIITLQEPLAAGYAAGTPVRQLRPNTPPSGRPATRDGYGSAWRSDPMATPPPPRPATRDGFISPREAAAASGSRPPTHTTHTGGRRPCASSGDTTPTA